MVVGGQHDVEPCVDTGLQVFVGGTELRIAGIRLATQRHLEVAYGHVGAFHLVVYPGETLVVVVASVLLQCCVNLRTVLHQVASNQQAEVVYLSLLDSVGLCSLLRTFGTARSRCQRDEADGYYQEFLHQPAHYLLATAACSMGRHFL